jgi:hypothetical protein
MPTETIDRRSTLEAAYEAAEKTEPTTTEVITSTETAPTEQIEKTPEPSSTENSEKPVEKPTETTEAADKTENVLSVDKPPQSWRGPQKAKWDKLDSDVRQEVMRRERDIAKVMGDASQARHFVQQFQATVQPHSGRMQSLGVEPMQAINSLLEADRILSTSSSSDKARYMAKLISDYRIDVAQLDQALSSNGVVDPVASKVEALLAQRLAPFNQFMSYQQQQEQQARLQQEQQTMNTIETMANDPKFEHFNDVRGDMADIIDLQAKKGVYLTLEQAYNRAIAMNPEVSQVVATNRANEAKTEAARAANAKAQRALSASKSVGGSPSGLSSGASGKPDRRAAIEAAFTAAEGR